MKGARGGQRVKSDATATTDVLMVSVFPTPLGYWALVGRDGVLHAMTLGHPSAMAARAACSNPIHGLQVDGDSTDWHPSLRQRLENYAAGRAVTFDDIELNLPRMTPFQQQVIKLTRRLKYGETVTYGELAARAKHPRAARAVGTVMSTNRIPIIIPCHRVLSAGGLGGYSAPQGVSLKSRLLQLERATICENGSVGIE